MEFEDINIMLICISYQTAISFQIPKTKICCKICGKEYRQIIHHYKLDHFPTKYSSVPCYKESCELQFNSIVALKSHVYRNHSKKTIQHEFQFECVLCSKVIDSDKYFQHLDNHLKEGKCVECPFKGCTFSTNNVNCFRPHRSRKHPNNCERLCANYYKQNILILNKQKQETESTCDGDSVVEEPDESFENTASLLSNLENCDNEPETCDNLREKLKTKIAAYLLQLETVSRVPTSTVQSILSNLSDIKVLSKPLLYTVIKSITDKYNLESTIAREICDAVSTGPILSAHITWNSVKPK